MISNYEKSLKLVLKHEGGYSDHPRDPGGATMRGVTQRVYDGYRKRRGLGVRSVRFIADDEINDLYRQQYWNVVRADHLPSGLDYAVFDYAVNSGPVRAVKHLQQTLGVTADGFIGEVTLSAVNESDPSVVIGGMLDRRMKFLRSLSTWDVFGRGWTARVSGVRADALRMAAGASKDEVVTPPPAVEAPKPQQPAATEPASRGASIGQVMAWIVGALLAGLGAYFGFGAK